MELRYLHGRLRAGSLSWERLDLAGFLGHPSARTLLERSTVAPPRMPRDLWRMLSALSSWGLEPFVRGALAASRLLEKETRRLPDLQALHASERWLSQPRLVPTRQSFQAAQRLARSAVHPALEPEQVGWAYQAIRSDLIRWALRE